MVERGGVSARRSREVEPLPRSSRPSVCPAICRRAEVWRWAQQWLSEVSGTFTDSPSLPLYPPQTLVCALDSWTSDENSCNCRKAQGSKCVGQRQQAHLWSNLKGLETLTPSSKQRRLPLSSMALHCCIWRTLELPDLREGGSVSPEEFLLLLKIMLYSDAWCTVGNVLNWPCKWAIWMLKRGTLYNNKTVHSSRRNNQ